MSRQLTILVVDDDFECAMSVAELLAADNHRVIIAHNGQQAVEAYAAHRFDLGFFDVMMPIKNGVESFLEIRTLYPDAKIYFMSGYSETDLLERARKGGASGIFSKPADPGILLEIVERQAA